MIEYLIWSHEHGGWWRPGRVGYTPDWRQAGVYTRDEAIDICAGALGGWRPGRAFNEVPVRIEDVAAMYTTGVAIGRVAPAEEGGP